MSVLPTISILAGQLSRLRIDHQDQRRELRAALERVEELAMHDELTGLPNRRHINEWMEHEAVRSERRGQPLCVALLDLDHFKRVNDTFGHAVGDEVLRLFVTEAAAALRDGDVLARWGGEEFLLALPDTSVDAPRAIERLRAHLGRDATWASCPEGRVTFSAGLALQWPGALGVCDRPARHDGHEHTRSDPAQLPAPQWGHRRPSRWRPRQRPSAAWSGPAR